MIIIEYFKTTGYKMQFGEYRYFETDSLIDAVGAFRKNHPVEEYTIFKLSIKEDSET